MCSWKYRERIWMEGTLLISEYLFSHIIDKETLPDCVQHAGGNAHPPGQTEHPDPTDPAESRLWNGGAAPGSVSFHEIVFCHVFLSIWLLQDSVSLRRHQEATNIMVWKNVHLYSFVTNKQCFRFYLTYVLSNQTSHHHPLRVNKQECFGLRWCV